MVQFGAIRSRQKVVQLLAEILKQKSQWRFRSFEFEHFWDPYTGFFEAIRLFSVLSGFNHDANVVLSDSPTVS